MKLASERRAYGNVMMPCYDKNSIYKHVLNLSWMFTSLKVASQTCYNLITVCSTQAGLDELL